MSVIHTYETGIPVGLRELRAQLARVIDTIKDGHSYTVTEHGRPVARLIPIENRSTYDRLVNEGVIQPATRTIPRPKEPIVAKATVSDLISEQRR
ncbi:MAG: type II toxin-antitoxin system prevent-host-death family antitoxin [Propionibacteriaceae bacterium]|jgi:prevent-host-death family protein|nr:type II toxin-antitoxin system prevent-host-death family antitoxin [Propionibacteriaceae bacterium]